MSKLQRLRDNIEVLRHALTSTSEYDIDILKKYTGFGGLNFVLNPLDTAAWAKSDLDFFFDTIMLHQLLKDESKDEREFKAWMQSVKESISLRITRRKSSRIKSMMHSSMLTLKASMSLTLRLVAVRSCRSVLTGMKW